MIATPLQRSGVFNSPITRRPAVAEEERPGAEGGDTPEGAGQARDPQCDRVHPFDAVTHLPPELSIEAEGNGETPRMPIGMTQADTIGMASRLASTP